MKTQRNYQGVRPFGSLTVISGCGFVVVLLLVSGAAARAQSEKRTIFTENDFHWQGNLKDGQTLEVINRNGDIEANGSAGGAAPVEGRKREGEGREEFIQEV